MCRRRIAQAHLCNLKRRRTKLTDTVRAGTVLGASGGEAGAWHGSEQEQSELSDACRL